MEQQKTRRLNIRLNESEHSAIARRSASAGLTISDYVRKCALQDQNRPIIRTDAETLKKLYANLRRAGSNLNQCARELNTRHNQNQVEEELSLVFASVAFAASDVSKFIADTRNSI